MSQKDLLTSFLAEWKAGTIRVRTSGSTGNPKTINLPKTQVERSARRTTKFFNITEGSRLHSAISFSYIGGKMMIARSLIVQCNLTFSEPSLTPDFTVCNSLSSNGATEHSNTQIDLMSVVPAQLDYILSNPEGFYNVKRFLIGGCAIEDRLWNRIVDREDERSGDTKGCWEFWESYGMTETASHIAVRRVSGKCSERPGFMPLEGIDIWVNNKGCLVVKDGEYEVETNDVAEILPDGLFIIKGRSDNMIITGGLKILPQEIEKIIKPVIDHLCRDFYITSVPDEKWTSKIVLGIVPENNGKEEFSLDTLSILKERVKIALDSISIDSLPRKLRPKEIVLIPFLPLTASGKLDRLAALPVF